MKGVSTLQARYCNCKDGDTSVSKVEVIKLAGDVIFWILGLGIKHFKLIA